MRCRFCVLLAIGLTACAQAANDSSRVGATSGSVIGYPSVDAALADLNAQPGNVASVQGGWTIISNPNNPTIWSFTPDDHPAHPAVVKRTAVERNGGVDIRTRALCEAKKDSCDALIEQFKQLNDQMREYMREESRRSSGKQSAPGAS
jgi:hypothetical protein